jgi:DNA-3-methyladenine glycosylase I
LAKKGLVEHDDGITRCWWAGNDADYLRYHDKEWGRPPANDHRLFEKVCLEGFQAGLSWLTILRKRENFRLAFKDFDFTKVARFNERSVARLLRDEGIIRHRGKIEATINNARRAPEIIDEFGSLTKYFCQFAPTARQRPRRFDHATLMKLAQTPQSQALSKDLKARGWKFVGPTTMYALMQAMGLVNDHIEGCKFREASERARRKLPLPSD